MVGRFAGKHALCIVASGNASLPLLLWLLRAEAVEMVEVVLRV